MAAMSHALIGSIPKSGTVFIRRTIEKTLGAAPFRLFTPEQHFLAVDVIKFEDFLKAESAVCVDHFSPTPYLMNLLSYSGIDKIVVQVRDPRDVIVSMRHHLDRADVRGMWWVKAYMTAAKTFPPDYFEMDPTQQMDAISGRYFDWLQEWLASWIEAIETDKRFSYHILNYPALAANSADAIRSVFKFYGHDQNGIDSPAINREGGGIDASTHFRRGVDGSHRDEMTPSQIDYINSKVNRDVFRYFGWQV